MPFDAVIFDLDGTLLDTERLTVAAGTEAFAAMGIAIPTAFLHGLVGHDRDSGAARIRARFPELDIDALEGHWGSAGKRLAAQGVPLKPGAQDLVTWLSGRFPLAVATSSYRVAAEDKLERCGLRHHFSALVSVNCVTRPKPAPEPYLLAAERLGVAAARCLAFEDSEAGAEAAHAAGLRVVQVPDMQPTEGRHAHHLSDSLLAGARAAGLPL